MWYESAAKIPKFWNMNQNGYIKTQYQSSLTIKKEDKMGQLLSENANVYSQHFKSRKKEVDEL